MFSDARILFNEKSDFFPCEIIEQFVGFLMRQKHPILLLCAVNPKDTVNSEG
jgi:hypothetical protein